MMAAVVLLPGIACATPEHPVVVSLGDSYSSGEGVEPFYEQDTAWSFFSGSNRADRDKASKYNDWLAHRSQCSWPGKLVVKNLAGKSVTLKDAKGGGEDVDWYFVASSGAETCHMTGTQNKDVYCWDGIKKTYSLPAQLDVFDTIEKGSVDYVTVSIGGNDMGFADILKSAAAESWSTVDPNRFNNELNKIWKEKWPNDDDGKTVGVHDKLGQVYRDIANEAGDQAKILVVGYPKLISESYSLYSGRISITESEAEAINWNVSSFNNQLKMLVEELREEGLNIYFVSVEDKFSGHEAYSEDPWLNEIILGAQGQDLSQCAEGLVSAYSIHPNSKGIEAYREVVQEAIDSLDVWNTGWEACGTCEWKIDDTGCLIVRPQNGVSGTLADWSRTKSLLPPWYTSTSRIRSVKIMPGVSALTMSNMFSSCISLASVDLSGLDTSRVTSMCCAFAGCFSLASIDLSGLDASNLTDMRDMFTFCYSLVSLDLTGFDTSNVEAMSHLFCCCESLISLNLSSFDTSKVTETTSMFLQCKSLETLDISSFDVSNVRHMTCMFADCESLTSLDVSNFDTSKAEDMNDMFRNCSSLVSVKVGCEFSFNGANSSRVVSLPTPSGDGCTGKWVNVATGQAYAGSEVPNNIAAHYVVQGAAVFGKIKVDTLACPKSTLWQSKTR